MFCDPETISPEDKYSDSIFWNSNHPPEKLKNFISNIIILTNFPALYKTRNSLPQIPTHHPSGIFHCLGDVEVDTVPRKCVMVFKQLLNAQTEIL